ncbi:hypothetical protein RBB50_010754 [Rhinocladiella similis]
MSSNKPEKFHVEVEQPKHTRNDSISDHIAVHTSTFDVSDAALGKDLSTNYFWSPRFVGLIIGSILTNNAYIIPYIYAANAIPEIVAEFGESIAITWIPLAWNLCYSVSLLSFGRLADVFGRRYFLIGANAMAVLGCIISGTAHSSRTIVGGQVLTGLAGAVQSSFTIWLAELIPKKLRPLINSAIYISAAVGYGLGPAITRQLLNATDGNWRWVFYFPLILNGVTLVIFTLCYFPPGFKLLHMRRSRWEQFKRTDFGGLFLFTAGLLLFTMGLSLGGNPYPWKSARVLSLIIVGACSLVVFGLWETRYTGDQILPTHLRLKVPGFIAMAVCAGVGSCVVLSSAILWPQQVNSILPGTPDHRSWLASVQTSCALLGLGLSGVILAFVTHHKYVFFACCVVMTTFVGVMVSVQPGQTAKAASSVALISGSCGIIECASRSLLPLSCPDEDIGAAIGILGTFGFGSSSVATAMYVAILTSKLKSILPGKIESAALKAGLPSSSLESLLLNYSTNMTAVPGITPHIMKSIGVAVEQGYADSFRYVWYAGIALSACSIVSACFIHNYSAHMVDEVSRKLVLKKKGHHEEATTENDAVSTPT